MFGKGGGALSTWIKEFCELVFIQTLQAFIYAIVIVFIAKILVEGNSVSGDDRNTAVGIICVIALTAIFKVEEILRKVLGFGQTKADPGNAIASLGKTAFAMKLGASVLDNGKKILGGIGAVAGSHSKKVKALQNRNKDIEAVNKDMVPNRLDAHKNEENVMGAAATPSVKKTITGIDATKRDRKIDLMNRARQSRLNAQEEAKNRKVHIENAQKKLEMSSAINDKNSDGSINSKMRDQKIALYEQAQHERELAKQATDREKQYIEAAKSQLAMARGIDDKIEIEDTSSAAAVTAIPQMSAGVDETATVQRSGGSSGNGNYHQKMREIEKNYQKELSEINKGKKEGFKNIARGLTETGFAVVGATTGAIIGGADGNLAEAAQGAVAGAGIGDKVGQFTVDTSAGIIDFAADRAKNAKSMVTEYANNVNQALQDAEKEKANIASQIDTDTRNAINDINRQAQMATSKTNTQRVNNRKNAINALKSGAVKTYQNHSVRNLNKQYDKIVKEINSKINVSEKYDDKHIMR